MKKKIIKITVTVLCVLIVAVGGYFGFKKFFGKSKSAAAGNTYIVETARMGSINETIQATGSAYAASTKDIAPNNSGELEDFSLKVGDTVTKGQTLFEVYSDQLKQAVDSAELKLKQAQVTLTDLQDQYNSQTSSQTSSQNKQGGSQQGGNQQGSSYQQGGQNSQAVTQNQIDLQELQVQSAQDSLNEAKQQYNAMTVTSPINGVVTAVNNANGDQVQSGKAVLTITDPTSIKVQTQVDELDIAKVKIGQKAQITFNAIQGQTYTGTVESISSIGSSSNNVTTYGVVVDLDNISGVMVGMTANVNIEVAAKSNVVVIPYEALIQRNGQNYVMVENSSSSGTQQGGNSGYGYGGNGQGSNSNGSGSYGSGQNGSSGSSRQGMRGAFGGTTSTPGRLVPVQVGIETETEAEITSGLNAGDKLMVQLPQVTSGTTNNQRSSFTRGMGGFGGGGFGGGGFGGGNYGGGSGSRKSGK